MTFDEWWKTLYGDEPPFDGSGDFWVIAMLAWNTSRLFERDRCARVVEELASSRSYGMYPEAFDFDTRFIELTNRIREGI